MAWFTDADIYDLLIKKSKSGVHIELLLLDHESNKEKYSKNQGLKQFEKFKLNLNVLKQNYAVITLIDSQMEFFMHSKFCVIDQVTVITGSYNWTYPAANWNIENIVIIKDENVAAIFSKEYDRVKGLKQQRLLNVPIMPKCKICGNLAAYIRIYDFYNKTSQYYEDVKDIVFCIHDPVDHLEVLADTEEWPFELGDLLYHEHERMEQAQDEDPDLVISKRQATERINNAVADYMGSTNDLFLENAKKDTFIVAQRVGDYMDDGETAVFKIIWNNELLDEFAEKFVDFSVEIMEELYY